MTAEVFTKPGCPYCVAAKQLLVKKNIPYVERDITRRDHWDEIKSRVPGFRTVPQIFLEGRHIGGFDDLALHFKQLAGAEKATSDQLGPAQSVGSFGRLFSAGASGIKRADLAFTTRC